MEKMFWYDWVIILAGVVIAGVCLIRFQTSRRKSRSLKPVPPSAQQALPKGQEPKPEEASNLRISTKECPNCGNTLVPEDARFCPSCGYAFSNR